MGTEDSDIDGETDANYTPTADDVDKSLRVRVSYTDDTGNPESLTSVSTNLVIPANTPAEGVPVISGTARVGETLVGSTDGISDADGLTRTYTYLWYTIDPNTGEEVRRKATPGYVVDNNPDTYTILSKYVGMKIRLKVNILDDHCNWENVFSAETEAVTTANSSATGMPVISGTAQVGETLTADTSGISDEDGLENATFSYQWLADDTVISGATRFHLHTPSRRRGQDHQGSGVLHG